MSDDKEQVIQNYDCACDNQAQSLQMWSYLMQGLDESELDDDFEDTMDLRVDRLTALFGGQQLFTRAEVVATEATEEAVEEALQAEQPKSDPQVNIQVYDKKNSQQALVPLSTWVANFDIMFKSKDGSNKCVPFRVLEHAMKAVEYDLNCQLLKHKNSDCGWSYLQMSSPSNNRVKQLVASSSHKTIKLNYGGKVSWQATNNALYIRTAFGIKLWLQPWDDVVNGSFMPAWLVQRCSKDSDCTTVMTTFEQTLDFSYQSNVLSPKTVMTLTYNRYQVKMKDSTFGLKKVVLKRKMAGDLIEAKGADKAAKSALSSVRTDTNCRP